MFTERDLFLRLKSWLQGDTLFDRRVCLLDEIEFRFPGKVEITDLFEYPTVNRLADYIQSR